MQATAQTAIGRRDNIFRAYYLGELDDAICHEARMLYRVGGVRNHAWVNHGAFRQRVVLPHAPFVRVTR